MSIVSEKYKMAKDQYAAIGVDTDAAIEKLSKIPVSVHCWQGDDVTGFENVDGSLTGGIQVTGAYPGKARNPEELRQDIKKAFSFIPGELKLNLHAIYLEAANGQIPDRDVIKPENFANWVEFAKENKIGLDFNPTLFSHDKSADGFTLSSANDEKRNFWIEHCKASRKIGEYFGKELGRTCVTNIWIADGFKDVPVDRLSPRLRLKDSLDKILEEKIDPKYNLDAVECKLFGIGSESCVIGSHEFYMGYAMKNNILLSLDAGHFHPTEVISDKISSVLTFCKEVLLHVSRPVRWDSDHIVTLNDELSYIAEEIIRNDFTNRVHIGLDYFDGSVNRIAAWVIGTRNMKKALLKALLEPTADLKKAELDGDYTTRLAMLEELKTFPIGLVWDYYCEANNVPAGVTWLADVKKYEQEVLLKRN